jgi:RNA polymerase sporulation-specific sigma factor
MNDNFEKYFNNLVFQAQKDEHSATQEILDLLKPLRFNLAKKFGNKGLEFDDLISQIDLLVIQAVKNYDPKKDVSAMRHVVSRTRNTVWNFYRQEMHYFNKKKFSILKDPKGLESMINDNNQSFEDRQIDKIVVEEALNKLTEKQRRVIKLYYWNKCTDSEIDQFLKVDQSNVTRARQRGLLALTKLLAG